MLVQHAITRKHAHFCLGEVPVLDMTRTWVRVGRTRIGYLSDMPRGVSNKFGINNVEAMGRTCHGYFLDTAERKSSKW